MDCRTLSMEQRMARYLVYRVLMEATDSGRFLVAGLDEDQQERLHREVERVALRQTVSQTFETRRLLNIPPIVKERDASRPLSPCSTPGTLENGGVPLSQAESVHSAPGDHP